MLGAEAEEDAGGESHSSDANIRAWSADVRRVERDWARGWEAVERRETVRIFGARGDTGEGEGMGGVDGAEDDVVPDVDVCGDDDDDDDDEEEDGDGVVLNAADVPSGIDNDSVDAFAV